MSEHVWQKDAMVGHIFSALSDSTRIRRFGAQWVRCGVAVNWPAQSPDLNPLEFWLWGHLKALEYSARINDLEVLLERVENACQEIRVEPGIFDRARISVRRRAASCVDMHGNHIEHRL
jgi:hypothetical protein